ncbi:acyl-CoA dehydrogenase family protein [Myxosarcina sp. GI1]|uniref:acyl-CoA dehydrogenase family protein n=1 Tax=Myxosarcina sp. GI1 TaxID=1541065 RepID=UPI00056BEDDD|nr:acyl-CoA dehydrogenase family protein [Myxosarcina sp. GI1]
MSDFLTRIGTYLRQAISPQACTIDRDSQSLHKALLQMGERSLLALRVPQHLGGMGLSETSFRRFQMLMARYSGALTFLQTQHQSAAMRLAKSQNQVVQQQYLSDMATGKILIGVGYSHLRRVGKPMVTATETAAGYLLNGKVPWITGYGCFDLFIIGGVLADGRELYGIVPFVNLQQETGGKLTFSQPMQLIAATATNTVSAELNNWLMKRERLVTINPPGSIHLSSRQNILNHGFYALGCAYAGLDLLKRIGERKQLDFISETWQTLSERVAECDRGLFAAISDKDITYSEKLQLRIQAIALASRCSHAAVIAAGGAANYLDSDVGRVYREALLFSVSGQTKDVMEASLKNII